MLVEKLGDLAEYEGCLGQAIVEQVLRVRLAFVDFELSFDSGGGGGHDGPAPCCSAADRECRWSERLLK
jgi:hypothetical protein